MGRRAGGVLLLAFAGSLCLAGCGPLPQGPGPRTQGPPSVPSLSAQGRVLSAPFRPLTTLPSVSIRFAGAESLGSVTTPLATTVQEGGNGFAVRLQGAGHSPMTALYGWGHALLTPQPGSPRLAVRNGFSQMAPFVGMPYEMQRILGTAVCYGPPQAVGTQLIAGQETRGYRWTDRSGGSGPTPFLTVYVDRSGQVLGMTGLFAWGPAYGANPPESFRLFATRYQPAPFQVPGVVRSRNWQFTVRDLTRQEAALLPGAAYRPLQIPSRWILTGITAGKGEAQWHYLTGSGPLRIGESAATVPVPLETPWTSATVPNGRLLNWLAPDGGAAGAAFVTGRTRVSLVSTRIAYLQPEVTTGVGGFTRQFPSLQQPTLFAGPAALPYRFAVSPRSLFSGIAMGGMSGIWPVRVGAGLVFALPPVGSVDGLGNPLTSGPIPIEYVAQPKAGETVTRHARMLDLIPAGPSTSLINLSSSGPRQVTWETATISPRYRRSEGTVNIP